MSSHYGQLAALLVFLTGSGLYLGWHRDVARALPALEAFAPADPQPEPVLILLLGSPESVESVRAAVAPDRIVASTENAFALEGGRIVTVDVESAAGPINAAGWSERPLEILTAAEWAKPELASDASAGPALATLANKPTLTQSEALQVLQHLH